MSEKDAHLSRLFTHLAAVYPPAKKIRKYSA